MNDSLLPDPDVLRAALAGTRWQEIAVVAETGSTNADLAARAAADDRATDGAVLIAGHQRTGRGRHARVWQTPPGQLAVSAAIVVDEASTGAIGWLSLLTGLAVREGVAELTGIEPDLKWPNDVLAPAGVPGAGRKLSGILCEFVPASGGGGTAVIGTGLNLDLTAVDPPIETAACLRSLTGAPVDPTALAAAYLRSLSRLLDTWPDDLGALAAAYRTASATLGEQVRLMLPGDVEVVGRAVEVDAAGRIVIDPSTASGRSAGPVIASAGDVTHLRPIGGAR